MANLHHRLLMQDLEQYGSSRLIIRLPWSCKVRTVIVSAMPWSCKVCTVIVDIDTFLCCNVCGTPREFENVCGTPREFETNKRPRDEPEAVEPPVKERKLEDIAPPPPPAAAPPPPAAAPRPRAAPPQPRAAPGPRRKYVVLLMVEDGDAEHAAYLARCERACDAAIHRHCFQIQDTHHFTIVGGDWTDAEAASVRFASPPPLPARVPLTHHKPWKSCLALGVDDATAATVEDVAARLAVPEGARFTTTAAKLHLSLYRGRGRGGALAKQMGALRGAAGGGYGSVVASRVVVKVVGADYAASRTVAS